MKKPRGRVLVTHSFSEPRGEITWAQAWRVSRAMLNNDTGRPAPARTHTGQSRRQSRAERGGLAEALDYTTATFLKNNFTLKFS